MILLLSLTTLLVAKDTNTWQLNGLSVDSQSDGVKLRVESLIWPDSQPIKAIDYWCQGDLYIYPVHQCNNAQVSFNYGGQSYAATLDSAFDFRRSDWKLALSTTDEQLAVAFTSDSSIGQIKFKQLNIQSITTQLMSTAGIPTLPMALIACGPAMLAGLCIGIGGGAKAELAPAIGLE